MSKKGKKSLSSAQIVSLNMFRDSKIICTEIKKTIDEAPDYLFIYFPSESQSKINIFPIETKIFKLLIKLQKFSPQLVKGISEVLKEMQVDENLIHTTGLCFSNDECYYETYMKEIDSDPKEMAEKLRKISFVLDVEFVEINKINSS